MSGGLWAALPWAREQRTGSPTDRFVLVSLALRCDVLYKAFPSKLRIKRDTEIKDVSTIRRALTRLERKGFIRRVPSLRPNGSHESNDYYLNVCPCSAEQLEAVDHDQQCAGGWLDGADTVDDVLARVAARESELRDPPRRRRAARRRS